MNAYLWSLICHSNSQDLDPVKMMEKDSQTPRRYGKLEWEWGPTSITSQVTLVMFENRTCHLVQVDDSDQKYDISWTTN